VSCGVFGERSITDWLVPPEKSLRQRLQAHTSLPLQETELLPALLDVLAQRAGMFGIVFWFQRLER
jgi:hypothetical protein